MRRIESWIVAALCALATAASVDRADACGACIHEATQGESTQVAGHRMLFSVSPQQTTLWDQIEYVGSPESFAWVLPVRAPVEVALSSDALFQLIDDRSRVTVTPPICNCFDGELAASTDAATTSSGTGGSGVTVIAQETVGPYETVQLESSDGQALFDWLASHNYVIPPDLAPVIEGYIAEGMDFLAMKLVPGESVSAMQPVRVTSPGAGLTLPLRMVAGGAGAYVPLNLWVFGEGRYEPQSHPWFVVDPDKIVWDWDTSSSNYADLVKAGQSVTDGRGWLVVSSLTEPEGPYSLLCDLAALQPESSGYDDGTGDGDAAGARCRADIDALLGDAPSHRATHLFANLPRAALDADLVLKASADQKLVSPNYQANLYTGSRPCKQCGGEPVPPLPREDDCEYGGGSGPAEGGLALAVLALIAITRRRA